MLQDTFVRLAQSGLDPEWMLTLDVDQFNALAESAERAEARRQLELLGNSRVAYHADAKDYKKFVKGLEREMRIPNVARDSDALGDGKLK